MGKYESTKEGRQRRADFEIKINKNKKIKLRFWIEKDNETFLASGRVLLLELIDKYKSIRKAATEMGISYRHAWSMVDRINKLNKKDVIKTSTGGEKGGGAELTEEGKKIIKEFYDIKNLINERLKDLKK